MTIKDVERIERDWLTTDEVSALLGSKPDSIRSVARRYGLCALGYPATWASEHTIKVPREGFLNWYRHNVMGVKDYGQAS